MNAKTIAPLSKEQKNTASALNRRTPFAVVQLCVNNTITHNEMLTNLLQRKYTFGHTPTADADGWVRGSWDDIELAYVNNMISDADFQQIRKYAKR